MRRRLVNECWDEMERLELVSDSRPNTFLREVCKEAVKAGPVAEVNG